MIPQDAMKKRWSKKDDVLKLDVNGPKTIRFSESGVKISMAIVSDLPISMALFGVVSYNEHIIWSNYSDLTRPHPKWWFSKGNPLISGKSRLVKYYNLARYNEPLEK